MERVYAPDMRGLVLVAAVTGLVFVVGGAASPQAGARSGCPNSVLSLSGVNPIAPATQAALRRVPARERPQVRGASLAMADNVRGPQVQTQCGDRVAARTIIVYITRRAYLPAQSASQGVYFVSRFQSGYRVWQVAH